MRIELLYFEGCPGFAQTLSTLEKVVAEEGIAAEIVPVARAALAKRSSVKQKPASQQSESRSRPA